MLFHGNIVVSLDDNHFVVFHTAKDGLKLPMFLKRALQRSESKWGNSGLVARIILSEMTAHNPLSMDDVSIQSEVVDNDNYVLSVNDRIQKVALMTETEQIIKAFSFEDFININRNPEWRHLIIGSYEGVFSRTGNYCACPFNITANALRRAGF